MGKGSGVPDFVLATLYRLRAWRDGRAPMYPRKLAPVQSGEMKRVISTSRDSPTSARVRLR